MTNINAPLSWDEWLMLLGGVVSQIEASGFLPDILVPSMNGGLVPGGIIAARLKARDVRPVSIRRENESRSFFWPKEGNIGDIRGKRILIIEDDVPTGIGITFLIDHLLGRGAKEVRVACVFKGHNSVVDFYARAMDPKDFPGYPWKQTNLGDRI